MNVLRSTSPVTTEFSPEPSTNRNSTGWITAVRIRMRSLRKRISSRIQTILIARSSDLYVRFGTRTRTTSVTALIAQPPGVSPPGRILPAKRARRARLRRSSARSRDHLHHHAVAVLGAVLLRVADRLAGEGHEDVVEARARDGHRGDRQL